MLCRGAVRVVVVAAAVACAAGILTDMLEEEQLELAADLSVRWSDVLEVAGRTFDAE